MKSTKRALIGSVLSMVLCVMLLLGTTFAWFTSTLETDVNELHAGNLDVSLMYSRDMAEWTPVTAATTDLFSGVAKWEPGATNVVYLKIVNQGSLAVKYDFTFKIGNETGAQNVEGNPFKLSDHIRLGYKEVAAKYESAAAALGDMDMSKTLFAQSNIVLATGVMQNDVREKVIAVVMHMPSDVGNVANYKFGTTEPVVPVSLKLVATQMTSESDSFSTEYDKDAELPAEDVEPITYDDAAKIATINTADGYLAYMSGGKNSYGVELGADIDFGNAELATITLTSLDGKGHTIKNARASNYLFTGYNEGILGTVKDLTLENITITGTSGDGTAAGIFGSDTISRSASFTNITLKNCRISGAAYCGALAGNIANAEFTACKALDCNITASKTAGALLGFVQTDNGTITVTGCSAEGGSVTVTTANRPSVGTLIGRATTPNGSVTVSDSTATGVTVTVGEVVIAEPTLIGDTAGYGYVTVNGAAYKK